MMRSPGADSQVYEENKGYTGNDTHTFYFIGVFNAIVFVLAIALFSGGKVPAALSPSGAASHEGLGWLSLGKAKWAAGAKPWIDSDHPSMDEDKAKVVRALQRMMACEQCTDEGAHCTPCNQITSNAEVLTKLFDNIDTKEELDEFEHALSQEFKHGEDGEFKELLDKMKSYLKATRAEMMDTMSLALLAGCFGLVMFVAFNAYADSCAKETEALEKEE